jgi:hypothetical protein
MAALAMNLLPMFLGNGGGGISGVLGGITNSFGNIISGVGNSISQVGGNANMGYAQPVAPKSNKKMYFMIGSLSFVIILGAIVIIKKK